MLYLNTNPTKTCLDSFQPRTVCVMPMFHAFVNVAVLPTLRAGGQVITLPKFEPFSYVEALERYKVRHDKMIYCMRNVVNSISHVIAHAYYMKSNYPFSQPSCI